MTWSLIGSPIGIYWPGRTSRAAEFPFDEGRKLSIALHLEMDDLAKAHKIVRASSGSVTILTPAQRRTAGGLDPDAATWPTLIDALHGLMLVYEEEGLAAAKAWLSRTGKADDQKFHDLVEAAIHAVPRVKERESSSAQRPGSSKASGPPSSMTSPLQPIQMRPGEAGSTVRDGLTRSMEETASRPPRTSGAFGISDCVSATTRRMRR